VSSQGTDRQVVKHTKEGMNDIGERTSFKLRVELAEMWREISSIEPCKLFYYDESETHRA